MAACTPHPHPVWFQSLGNLPISLHTSSRSQPPLSISTPTSSASSHTGFRSEESTFQNLRLFPREKMGGGGQEEGGERREKPEVSSGNIKAVTSPTAQVCSREKPQSAHGTHLLPWGPHPVFSFSPDAVPPSLEDTRDTRGRNQTGRIHK